MPGGFCPSTLPAAARVLPRAACTWLASRGPAPTAAGACRLSVPPAPGGQRAAVTPAPTQGAHSPQPRAQPAPTATAAAFWTRRAPLDPIASSGGRGAPLRPKPAGNRLELATKPCPAAARPQEPPLPASSGSLRGRPEPPCPGRREAPPQRGSRDEAPAIGYQGAAETRGTTLLCSLAAARGSGRPVPAFPWLCYAQPAAGRADTGGSARVRLSMGGH